MVVIDGTKFKAANSLDGNFNRKKLLYRMKIIDEHVSKYLAEIQEEDRKEEQANSQHVEIFRKKCRS